MWTKKMLLLAIAISLLIGVATGAHLADGEGEESKSGSYSSGNYFPSKTPPEAFVYVNFVGNKKNKWVIGPGNNPGSGKYILPGDSTVNTDTLKFEYRATVDDDRDDVTAPVSVWVYKATGGGNTGWFAFGIHPLDASPDRYPLYIAFDNPKTGGKFERILTLSGTTRN